MRAPRDPSGRETGEAEGRPSRGRILIHGPAFIFVSNTGTSTPRQLTRAEQEAQAAAERLSGQIEDALRAVASKSGDGTEELEACADRLERAARDLAVALRELAESGGASGAQE